MRRLAKFVVAVAAFGTVSAIAAPDQTPAAPAPATATNQMSVGDMNVAAASLEARLEDDSTDVAHLQEIAKKQKDVIKLNCVNDRMVQLKAQRNIADETHSQLQASLAKNGPDRFTLFQSMQSTADAIHELREQARACIGEPELLKQESGVTVEHPPIIDDPGTITPPVVTIEPPGYASVVI